MLSKPFTFEGYMNRGVIILAHIVFWLAYTALLYSIFSGRAPEIFAWTLTAFFLAMHIPMVYTNMQVLIPRLYLKKKYILYSVSCIVILAFIVIIFQMTWTTMMEAVRPHEFSNFPKPPSGSVPFNPNRPSMSPPGGFRFRGLMELSITLSVLLLSSVVKISQIANRKDHEAEVLRSENLNSELKFLKSQINPHFLFNTLNNIYALSLLKSDKTSDTVLRLSEMLRYVLYECSVAEKVPVSKEVIYIKNYIALQLLRDSKITNVNFTADIQRDVDVAPMLFIPFIENAFKHSKIENIQEGWISIVLTTKSNSILFTVENSKPKLDSSKDTTGGIGIENVKRRLNLLYIENHFLDITQSENSFKVKLELLM